MGPTVHRTRYSTQDPDQALDILAQVYSVRQWTLTGTEGFHLEVATTTIGALTLEAARTRGAAGTQTVDFTDTLRIDHLTAGRLAIDTVPDKILPATPLLLPPAGYTQRWSQAAMHSVALDPTAVQAHARALHGNELVPLRFTGFTPVSTAASRYWTELLTHTHRHVLSNKDATDSPLILDQTVRHLLTTLLHTFPSTFLDAPEPSRDTAPVPAALRRATSFIDSHLAESIGIIEIAQAARLSPRGLQAAFRRHLDTTPTAYLRGARLAAAHHDLLAADPATGATVGGIAARWGFAHRGRFATAYRRIYDQSPTTTLRC